MTENEFHSSFFKLHEVDDVAVVTMTRDQLSDDDNLEQLDQELMQILGVESGRKLVCDLSSVKYLTSSAIGKLISLHRKSTRTDSQVVLCNLQPTVQDILSKSHLLQYFTVADNSDAAILKLSSAT